MGLNQEHQYYSHSRSEILPFLPSGIKFALDVGCGNGSFGKILKEHVGCVVWGVEPNQTVALEAQQNLDKVINSPFDKNLNLEHQKFDCIFFNDVLEHLVNPYSALNICKLNLSKNGCIISSIPNILHFDTIYKILITQDWKYEDAGILDKTHLRFFTKKSIIRMFEECGYKIVSIQGINPAYSTKFKWLNKMLFNHLNDMKYIQYLTVVQTLK